jgi:hypothetical protein
MQYLLLPLLSLVASAFSSPLSQSHKSCREYTIPLEITTENLEWTFGELKTNTDATAYNAQAGRRDAKQAFKPYALPKGLTTKTYNVSGAFCEPDKGGDGTVMLATHGGAYDRQYWHPSYQPANYSFVDFAVAKGYSIFYYDRVGQGKSSKYVKDNAILGSTNMRA